MSARLLPRNGRATALTFRIWETMTGSTLQVMTWILIRRPFRRDVVATTHHLRAWPRALVPASHLSHANGRLARKVLLSSRSTPIPRRCCRVREPIRHVLPVWSNRQSTRPKGRPCTLHRHPPGASMEKDLAFRPLVPSMSKRPMPLSTKRKKLRMQWLPLLCSHRSWRTFNQEF